jgi:hypothetical protein
VNTQDLTIGAILRVHDWDELYENNRTRNLKVLAWIPYPNRLDGDGYTELVDHANGAAHLGAWTTIIQVASRCEPRGVLVRDNGEPHTPLSLARVSRLPAEIYEEVIPRLVKIGWLTPHHSATAQHECATGPHLSATAPHDAASESAPKERMNEWKEGKEPDPFFQHECATGPHLSATAPHVSATRPLSHDQPSEAQSLDGPFEWFKGMWLGGIPEDCWRVFGEKVNTSERLAALQANAPLWVQIKRYRDGFTDGNAFLRSGVWLSPPNPELLPMDVFDRAIKNSREDPEE